MFSLFVGLIAIMVIISAVWITAGKLGVFDFIGNTVLKIKDIFKEEKGK
ncbi:hypothetical protein P9Z39_20985 [Bacillus thuringiensis]|nr:hypothetical protein [Bacillus thuringiensis]MCC2443253.1 hypothetical protein [Bacillus cereus]MEC2708131.1 hypothetical protein [Bacillus thuringiensis]